MIYLLLFLLSVGISVPRIAEAQETAWEGLPRDFQLCARGEDDSCSIEVEARITRPGIDSLIVTIERNNLPWRRRAVGLEYVNDTAHVFFTSKLYSELAEFSLFVFLDDSLEIARDSLACGDIYLLNGQSNARATDFDGLATWKSEWVRSFGSSIEDSLACASDTSWGVAQGSVVYTHMSVGVLGLTFGRMLTEQHGVPVGIINGAVGGTRIEEHLRTDPSGGGLGTIYGRLLYRTEKAGATENVRAILWHQGEGNADWSYHNYTDDFTVLYTSWKEDYAGLERIYLFQIRPGCGGDYQAELREVQRDLSTHFPDVEVMSTVGLPDHDGCHYHYNGYTTMAEWVALLAGRDFHASTDTAHIRPPNVMEARYSDDTFTRIVLLFDRLVLWPADTLGVSMKEYLYLDGMSGLIDSGYASADTPVVVLRLTSPYHALNVTYLPNRYYTGTETTYAGPWLRNSRGIGALSFHNLHILGPITASIPSTPPHAGFPLFCRNQPNPFNPQTTLRFTTGKGGPTLLAIYDLNGRLVRTLVHNDLDAGIHETMWDGRNNNGHEVSSGIYYSRLETEQGTATAKMTLIK